MVGSKQASDRLAKISTWSREWWRKWVIVELKLGWSRLLWPKMVAGARQCLLKKEGTAIRRRRRLELAGRRVCHASEGRESVVMRRERERERKREVREEKMRLSGENLELITRHVFFVKSFDFDSRIVKSLKS